MEERLLLNHPTLSFCLSYSSRALVTFLLDKQRVIIHKIIVESITAQDLEIFNVIDYSLRRDYSFQPNHEIIDSTVESAMLPGMEAQRFRIIVINYLGLPF